jgi:integrase
MNRLTAVGVDREKKPGLYPDGGGLYLNVKKTGSKSWIFRYQLHHRAREMGLGSLSVVSLADARRAAAECRRVLHQGLDPLEERRRLEEEKKGASGKTFREVAEACIAERERGFRSTKHRKDWPNSLQNHIYPHLGDIPIQDIDTRHVLGALTPIWQKNPVTAGRLRGRIEKVVSFAVVHGWRKRGPNPAAWKGNLEDAFQPPSKVKPVQHMEMLPYDQAPELMAKLMADGSVACLALAFTILTGARTSEVRLTTPAEFDLEAGIWTLSVERHKTAKNKLRRPLSGAAKGIVEKLRSQHPGHPYVFAGIKPGRPVGQTAMIDVLRKYDSKAHVHGMRAAFRSWCTDHGFDREIAELTLGHRIGDESERAYARGEAIERRRNIAEAWAQHCLRSVDGGNVVQLRGA